MLIRQQRRSFFTTTKNRRRKNNKMCTTTTTTSTTTTATRMTSLSKRIVAVAMVILMMNNNDHHGDIGNNNNMMMMVNGAVLRSTTSNKSNSKSMSSSSSSSLQANKEQRRKHSTTYEEILLEQQEWLNEYPDLNEDDLFLLTGDISKEEGFIKKIHPSSYYLNNDSNNNNLNNDSNNNNNHNNNNSDTHNNTDPKEEEEEMKEVEVTFKDENDNEEEEEEEDIMIHSSIDKNDDKIDQDNDNDNDKDNENKYHVYNVNSVTVSSPLFTSDEIQNARKQRRLQKERNTNQGRRRLQECNACNVTQLRSCANGSASIIEICASGITFGVNDNAIRVTRGVTIRCPDCSNENLVQRPGSWLRRTSEATSIDRGRFFNFGNLNENQDVIFVGIGFSRGVNNNFNGDNLGLNAEGGAVRFDKTTTESDIIRFVGCTFEFNVSTSYGGAVYIAGRSNTSVQFTRCRFIGNTAKNFYGGAIAIQTVGTVSIAGCFFFENVVQRLPPANNNINPSGGGGGAVFIQQVLGPTANNQNLAVDISDCMFGDRNDDNDFNAAARSGGALIVADVDGLVQLIRNDFSYNVAGQSSLQSSSDTLRGNQGAARIYRAEFVLVDNCYFNSNTAEIGFAGGLDIRLTFGSVRTPGNIPPVLITNTVFVDNECDAKSGTFGGGLSVRNTRTRGTNASNQDVTLQTICFGGNNARGSDSEGGAAYFQQYDDVNLNNVLESAGNNADNCNDIYLADDDNCITLNSGGNCSPQANLPSRG